MTDGTDGQAKKSPCSENGKVVSIDKIIAVIKDDTYDDDDARTCFWLYTQALPGDDPLAHPHAKRLLTVMKQERPDAHQAIRDNAVATLKD